MPFIAPHATMGGPANPERQYEFFRRWWDVHQRYLGAFRGYEELNNDVIQAQAHRTTRGALKAAALLTGRSAIDHMRQARQANGGINTDPYRIVLKAGPHYLASMTRALLRWSPGPAPSSCQRPRGGFRVWVSAPPRVQSQRPTRRQRLSKTGRR